MRVTASAGESPLQTLGTLLFNLSRRDLWRVFDEVSRDGCVT